MGKIIARTRLREDQLMRRILRHAEAQPRTPGEIVIDRPERPNYLEERYQLAVRERMAICEALGLEPWADLHKSIIPAIQGLLSALHHPV